MGLPKGLAKSPPGVCVVANAVSPRALLRKKFRRFIIAVISPVIQNKQAITTPLRAEVQGKSMTPLIAD
jgi:hypothetical protein